MYQLYLDTTNNKLTVVILQANKILASSSFIAWQKQTELAIPTITNLLVKCKIKLKDISKVVIANGPGSYTGIRVAITFVKTLKVLNSFLTVFTINSLLLQAGLIKSISVLSAYNNKSYLAVCDNGKIIIQPQLVDENAKIGIISDLLDYKIIENLEKCNIVENFQKLSPYFIEVKNMEDLQPYYINDPFSSHN
ncbi:MAG: tRNA (adenosine(37)-N6)-threonylcarbamoyltransferase complex dimerization subunit type 1 TsaB [Spiroplasma sp. WSS]|uniref:tRNA (adenosine(37)-N6)-threonylcarbamoyltransferase complex dimerization subunit type 1 TsaB n=1 Tax=unclassified Spiroplasma TaxID=2637901 RepID=UPI00121B0EF9|nr:tRNA (adenosine(37)-N6)-threonylcarbamoyltransferase complex dimerization subunit type 1 TsaB [Spiroplasma endosymbiont of Lariophagus distinguendus]TLF25187.1 MAG: tRNA (adenosine(37)-N6)-threonylcarbamoyltransferase complex dimerization subunit type 1 TsaB [Spiroplasma sp. WSS]